MRAAGAREGRGAEVARARGNGRRTVPHGRRGVVATREGRRGVPSWPSRRRARSRPRARVRARASPGAELLLPAEPPVGTRARAASASAARLGPIESVGGC